MSSTQKVNQNNIGSPNSKANVMFIDMNSFFPSCEQQVNYWLRHRPIGVCVYTGKQGSVIALSREAKKAGIKPARLDEIMAQHPDFIPLETNPVRYREFHIKIMKVLRSFSEDVIPKSIDEAVINFATYGLVYKDMEEVAKQIKKKIYEEVGEWMTCSIGIAPNAFLAKLASGMRKPDGLVTINESNIDSILSEMSLTRLPGISKGMALRLAMGGITSPLQIRHTDPGTLRKVCKSVVGEYWHYRLNFMEVDIANDVYKGMQAMRQISKEQRQSVTTLHDIIHALCVQLEKRMMGFSLSARFIGFSVNYEDGYSWSDLLHTAPLQGAIDMMNVVLQRIKKFEEENESGPIINNNITRMIVYVSEFNRDTEFVQFSLFENNVRKDNLRKEVYNLKNKFGFDKIVQAAQVTDTPVYKDVIGFGSIKDLVPPKMDDKTEEMPHWIPEEGLLPDYED